MHMPMVMMAPVRWNTVLRQLEVWLSRTWGASAWETLPPSKGHLQPIKPLAKHDRSALNDEAERLPTFLTSGTSEQTATIDYRVDV